MTNRAERRAQAKQRPAKAPIKINYGYNAEYVAMRFTRPTSEIVLTPQQAKDMIAALQSTIENQANRIGLPTNG